VLYLPGVDGVGIRGVLSRVVSEECVHVMHVLLPEVRAEVGCGVVEVAHCFPTISEPVKTDLVLDEALQGEVELELVLVAELL
jgi:hypothetical protein